MACNLTIMVERGGHTVQHAAEWVVRASTDQGDGKQIPDSFLK